MNTWTLPPPLMLSRRFVDYQRAPSVNFRERLFRRVSRPPLRQGPNWSSSLLMAKLHKIVGVSVVVIFLLTGQYMKFYYPRMEEINEGMRMMLRSRHIYLLLAGLINICLGAYFIRRETKWRRVLQMIGSLLILLASLLMVAAFFYEPKLANLQRTLTLPSIIALFTGTFFHLLSGGEKQGVKSKDEG